MFIRTPVVQTRDIIPFELKDCGAGMFSGARPKTQAGPRAAGPRPAGPWGAGPPAAGQRAKAGEQSRDYPVGSAGRQSAGRQSDVSGIGSAWLETGKQEVELSVGSARAQGVAVEQVKVGNSVGHIVIDRSRAVQVGDGNRQLNNFRYKVEQPRVSVDDLLRGHPGRQRAFEKLIDNPSSMVANWVFRQYLSGAARPQGRVRFTSASGPRMARVAARLDERGHVVVDRSQGVQMGTGVTQRNKFNYRVVRPELSLEPMLRGNARLARTLALTARYPGNAAAQRSFTGQLANAYKHPRTSFSDSSALLARTTGLVVSDGAGVQLGSDNIRKDRIDVSVRSVRVTHWTPQTRPSPITQPADNHPAQYGDARRPAEPRTTHARVQATPRDDMDLNPSRISPSVRSPRGTGGFSPC
jgi:hypothetical protein